MTQPEIGQLMDRDDEIEQLVEDGTNRRDAAALVDARAGHAPHGCSVDEVGPDEEVISPDEVVEALAPEPPV